MKVTKAQINEVIAHSKGWKKAHESVEGMLWLTPSDGLLELPNWTTDANAAFDLVKEFDVSLVNLKRGWRCVLSKDGQRIKNRADTPAMAMAMAWISWEAGDRDE